MSKLCVWPNWRHISMTCSFQTELMKTFCTSMNGLQFVVLSCQEEKAAEWRQAQLVLVSHFQQHWPLPYAGDVITWQACTNTCPAKGDKSSLSQEEWSSCKQLVVVWDHSYTKHNYGTFSVTHKNCSFLPHSTANHATYIPNKMFCSRLTYWRLSSCEGRGPER